VNGAKTGRFWGMKPRSLLNEYAQTTVSSFERLIKTMWPDR